LIEKKDLDYIEKSLRVLAERIEKDTIFVGGIQREVIRLADLLKSIK